MNLMLGLYATSPLSLKLRTELGLSWTVCHLQSSYLITDDDILEFLKDRDMILLGQHATSLFTLILKTELGLSQTPCQHQEIDSA